MIDTFGNILNGVERASIYYSNGAFLLFIPNEYAYISYDNGDLVVFDFDNGEWKVVRIQTHDGVRIEC